MSEGATQPEIALSGDIIRSNTAPAKFESHTMHSIVNDESGKTNTRRFTAWSQVRSTLFGSWVNGLFVLVPVGIALNYVNVSAAAVFAINFIAMIPSSNMISFAVEELGLRTGEIWGALLSNTFR
jgi:hypothetical protein